MTTIQRSQPMCSAPGGSAMTSLQPCAEYVIRDIYLMKMAGDPRARGDVRFRTDADGRVWFEGAGRPEDPCLTRTYAEHPRLERVR